MMSCVITLRTVILLDIAAFLSIPGNLSYVVYLSNLAKHGFKGFRVKISQSTSGRNRGEILTARLVLDRGSRLLACLAAGDDD